MIVCIFQLLVEVVDFALLLVQDDRFRVDVPRRNIRDLTGMTRIVQRAQILFKVFVRGRETRDHQCVRITTKTLLEEARQFGLTVRHHVPTSFLAT